MQTPRCTNTKMYCFSILTPHITKTSVRIQSVRVLRLEAEAKTCYLIIPGKQDAEFAESIRRMPCSGWETADEDVAA